MTTEHVPGIITAVYENNEGVLKLANTELPRTTPRSKHYGAIYHWFRNHVMNGTIAVLLIDTTNQLTTKGLTWVPFEKLREKLIGWYKRKGKQER